MNPKNAMNIDQSWSAMLDDSEVFNGMPCRRAGRSGLRLSAVGLGLWKWGDPLYDGSRVGDHPGFQILDRALELGMFHWDTACSYNMGSGNSERLLGRWFASRGPSLRDSVVLATKVKNPVRDEHRIEQSFTPNQKGASRLYIRTAVENGLRRLQTDRIDLLVLHSPSVDDRGDWLSPLEETWGCLDDLVTEGKVRYIGTSNFSARQLEEVGKVLQQVGKDFSRRVITTQNRYNLLERTRVTAFDRDPKAKGDASEENFLDFCRREGIGIIPYYPLASGALTGRYRKGRLDEAEGRIIDDGAQKQFLGERNMDIVEQLVPLAESAGISLAQLAIAWLLHRTEVASVIAGVTSMEQLEDNAKAAAVELSDELLTEIDRFTK